MFFMLLEPQLYEPGAGWVDAYVAGGACHLPPALTGATLPLRVGEIFPLPPFASLTGPVM